MSQPRFNLQTIEVPSPCTVPWRSMAGTEQVRFCSQCRESVYNLSEMTVDEAESFLSRVDGSACIRIYRRADGTVVNAERCNNRLTRYWRRAKAFVGGILLAMTSAAGGAGCSDQGKITCKSPAATETTTSTTKDVGSKQSP